MRVSVDLAVNQQTVKSSSLVAYFKRVFILLWTPWVTWPDLTDYVWFLRFFLKVSLRCVYGENF